MPELPEVETVVRGLSRHIVGQSIKDIRILNKKSFIKVAPMPTGRQARLRSGSNLKIKKISRRGKAVIITLSEELSLLIHLKMTGQLIYVPKIARHSGESLGRLQNRMNKSVRSWTSQDDEGIKRLNLGHPTKDFAEEMPSRHTRVIFELSKGALYFNDQRKFGWVKLVPTKDVEKDSFISKLGVEPLSRSFNANVLWETVQRHPNSPIKSTLMDQSLIAGVGNIYSDEALFVAGIRPDRKGKTITKPETKKLASAIKKVLELGIKHAGTSIANYKNAEGLPGRMQNYLKVYGRKNKICPHKCGVVKSIRIGGRSAHFCPICQH
ncbi:MAG: Formamidopyrimidine-DNA glycosylase [candidate division Kazan bacterium GW2011_GWA1_44_22]|uniref:Formamidopyrimidine-DNA glycosylase n=1 Tax=candidate division Kazan bacterium GW2011_GWA1_44_22 TaxID=1620410 RepID=A0A0G1KZF8_UNCK3|nr:MAG: Formamidopyrimidine-DNA glycosylase [candidate division Kazan bacterium GW2011_GWA1_44_22]